MELPSNLRDDLARYGQEHLAAFWDRLDAAGRAALVGDLASIDFAQIAALYAERGPAQDVRALADRAVSPPSCRYGHGGLGIARADAVEAGRAALEAGHVGAILVAGGQGTRLGFDHPKGMYAIGPVSGRSLFAIHVGKILAIARRFGASVPLYLMTSDATHEETADYFAANRRFGLPADSLRIFKQGRMPAVDAHTGKILLEAMHRVAMSPDGHGGTLAALARSGCLADALGRGIRRFFYFQVDNPLVEVCGPEFLGYHILCRSEFSSQVVRKTNPLDKVGNVVEVDGRLHVIEYFDLPDDVARRTAADGSPAIWAGSIAVHAIEAAFLTRMAESSSALPFHIARKQVAHVDAQGNVVKPAAPNAIKFERFIFDLMPRAERSIAVEVDASEHFAPLKNGPGEPLDSPAAVQSQMAALHRRWLRAAGVRVADDVAVEIAPSFALDAEQTRARVPPPAEIREATYLE
jgi:UDP-N-acetylglucosamine/UDP-N-acetylgalactosamine diphosphorylase